MGGDGCNNRGRDNNRRGNGSCGCDRDEHERRCERAVEKAVSECGSERAVMRTLKDRDNDCDCMSGRERAEAREERAERRAERTVKNNGCDDSGMAPSRWQDFPEVSRSSSRDDCGCDN